MPRRRLIPDPIFSGRRSGYQQLQRFDRAPVPERVDQGTGTSQEIVPQVTTIDLTNAGSQEVTTPGNVVLINYATDATVIVTLKYHNSNNPGMRVGKNFFMGGIPFAKLVLSWDAQAGKTIEVTTISDPSEMQYVRVE